jgi:5'-3' exonuclease
VILSDTNVPGEGEHKIINFIRRQRLQPGHDPNTHHLVFGSDSNLILLGLATHEPYFTIIYEDNGTNKSSTITLNNQRTNYIFIHLSTLREYLYYELEIDNSSSFERNLERAIDDWVFLCLLLGNDFLPNSPSIDIPQDAMGRLIRIYKSIVGQFGEYLTKNGITNMRGVAILLSRIGEEEHKIFMERHKAAQRQRVNDSHKNDTIQLWDKGWRERYYKDKFNVSHGDLKEFRTGVTQHYARGLCWVLQYYYQGEPSWDWYVFLTNFIILLFVLYFQVLSLSLRSICLRFCKPRRCLRKF